MEETIIGSPTIASYDPGRSLCSEVGNLSQKVQLLYEVVGRLVELQQEANKKLEAALQGQPINRDDASVALHFPNTGS